MFHNSLQDFYGIKNDNLNDFICVGIIGNVKQLWEDNKSMWFSHEPIPLLPLINTTYDNSLGINMSLILHYDQLYRHPNKNIIHKYKEIAYKFATNIALKMIHNQDFYNMKDWEIVFTLLTLRHNKNLNMKYFVLKKLYNLIEKEPTNSLYLRFLNATIMDIHNFKQTNYGYEEFSSNNINNDYNYIKNKYFNSINFLDEFNSILQKPKPKHLIEHSYIKNTYNKLLNEYKNTILSSSSNKFAISISGGVDSMILSYIMNILCNKLNKQLILLHICYNNRDCCSKEIELLKYWSIKINTPLYIRTIDEIKRERNSSYRTLYEDVTRKIRFSFYKYFNCPILLGHNKDDCFENLFSNLSKKIHYDNLFGMSSMSVESDVTILRPMLNITKQEIYDFADYYDIPHLYDSTPDWSNRGKMRDILIPSISNFDKNILTGLHDFTNYTIFLEKQWKMTFNNWIKNIKVYNNIVSQFNLIDPIYIKIVKDDFYLSNYVNLNFWIQLWFNLMLPTRPSNKSFSNLISHINKQKKHNNLCILNYNFNVLFTKEYFVITNKK